MLACAVVATQRTEGEGLASAMAEALERGTTATADAAGDAGAGPRTGPGPGSRALSRRRDRAVVGGGPNGQGGEDTERERKIKVKLASRKDGGIRVARRRGRQSIASRLPEWSRTRRARIHVCHPGCSSRNLLAKRPDPNVKAGSAEPRSQKDPEGKLSWPDRRPGPVVAPPSPE